MRTKKTDYGAWISNIGERDFWQNVRVPKMGANGDVGKLREAIRLGRTGKKVAAYTLLAQYHQTTAR